MFDISNAYFVSICGGWGYTRKKEICKTSKCWDQISKKKGLPAITSVIVFDFNFLLAILKENLFFSRKVLLYESL